MCVLDTLSNEIICSDTVNIYKNFAIHPILCYCKRLISQSLIFMENYKYILFDLDGTITDPMIGITKSVEFALNHLGIDVNDLADLCPFIGPPLKDSFREFYSLPDDQIEIALIKYRERYSEVGLYENYLYEGMKDILEDLDSSGFKLYLATSKPTVFAERILDHFNLINYFTFIGGSSLDNSRNTKTVVIEHVLQINNITDLSQTIMVGDRKHDIIGAKNVGIDSVGVLYGYGDYDELNLAGATYIVEDIKGLSDLLFSKKE